MGITDDLFLKKKKKKSKRKRKKTYDLLIFVTFLEIHHASRISKPNILFNEKKAHQIEILAIINYSFI